MEDEKGKSETTSRRNFTKAMVTAAVAAPIVASMTGCQPGGTANSGPRAGAPPLPSPSPSPIKLPDCPVVVATVKGDHIPPMGIDCNGELRIETHNDLKAGVTTPTIPPTYRWDEVQTDKDRKYGQLIEVVVIEEPPEVSAGRPFPLNVTRYCDLEADSELHLWYQPIVGEKEPTDPLDLDNKFETRVYDNFPADVIVIGGTTGRSATITVRTNNLVPSKYSHKESTPNLFRHEPDQVKYSPMRRYFRIGRWRIVKNTTVFGGEGGSNYRLYLRFAKFV